MTDKESGEDLAVQLMDLFMDAKKMSQQGGCFIIDDGKPKKPDWSIYKSFLIDAQKDFTKMYAKSQMEAAQELYATILDFIKDQLGQIKEIENKEKLPF